MHLQEWQMLEKFFKMATFFGETAITATSFSRLKCWAPPLSNISETDEKPVFFAVLISIPVGWWPFFFLNKTQLYQNTLNKHWETIQKTHMHTLQLQIPLHFGQLHSPKASTSSALSPYLTRKRWCITTVNICMTDRFKKHMTTKKEQLPVQKAFVTIHNRTRLVIVLVLACCSKIPCFLATLHIPI